MRDQIIRAIMRSIFGAALPYLWLAANGDTHSNIHFVLINHLWFLFPRYITCSTSSRGGILGNNAAQEGKNLNKKRERKREKQKIKEKKKETKTMGIFVKDFDVRHTVC